MKRQFKLLVSLFLLPMTAMAGLQSYYCPQHSAYISIGMTDAQVVNACGQPKFIETNDHPVVQQTPVTQLIYINLNRGAVSFYPGLNPVYSMWSLPSGSQGISVSVDVMNDIVKGITINGSGTNAMTICGGVPVQIGDPVSAVYAACGTPSTVNNTYVNKVVPSSAKPAIWTYQVNKYDPIVRLTFVDGTLQSID